MHRGPIETPAGTLWAQVDEAGRLVEILLPRRSRAHTEAVAGNATAQRTFDAARRQLGEYFARTRRTFDLPLKLTGSPFEVRVWERLLAIPYGTTISYGEIARELSLENGARAVGRANGDNPIPIVVPCHRVIGANGMLVGYGGGLALKRTLLELENVLAVAQLSLLDTSIKR